MTPPTATVTHPVATGELRAVLQEALGRHFDSQRRVEHLERRAYSYSSSYFLEELRVLLDDGSALSLIFKDLSCQTVWAAAHAAKPRFLYNPLREIDTYRLTLAASGLGTAICYGAEVDVGLGRYWLFLEKIRGVELFQVGEFGIWQEVARWLARMHARFATGAELFWQARAAHLLRHDGDYFRLWLRRAQVFVSGAQPARPDAAQRRFARLAEGYEQAIERLVTLPQTIIHGEFYASNVLVAEPVAEGRRSVRVCPVDWEMAAIGCGLIDLAALTAGRWSETQKATLAAAYYAALPGNGGRPWGWEQFLDDLDYCRLHLDIQWLGWSQQWSPPPEHVQNWLGEALHLAEKLGL